MIARRLLVGGSGSFLEPTVRTILSPAGWLGLIDSPVVTSGNVTFIGFVKDTGHVYAVSYDSSTHTATTPVDLATTTAVDGVTHNGVAILVRSSDQKIIAMYQSQFATTFKSRLSSNALDATAFAAETSGAVGDGWTFEYLVQLNDGTLYNLTKNGVHGGTQYLGLAKSTDQGGTWSLTVSHLIAPRTTTNLYWHVATDGTKIHIFTTDTDRVATSAALYHFYLESDVLHAGDGSSLAGSAPYAANTGTLIQDTSFGSCMIQSSGFDGSGQPAVTLGAYDAATPQTLYRIGRFNGTTWTTHAIDVSAGLLNGTYQFETEAAIDKTNPDVVWYSKKVGSHFEIFRGASADNGATWTATQITVGSTAENIHPTTPVNAAALKVLWLNGTIASSSSFSYDFWGYGI